MRQAVTRESAIGNDSRDDILTECGVVQFRSLNAKANPQDESRILPPLLVGRKKRRHLESSRGWVRKSRQADASAGIFQRLGLVSRRSQEVGKIADLVILGEDPLKDIRNTNTIRYAMKNGELFDGGTLDEVWPVKRPLGPLWWWNDDPQE